MDKLSNISFKAIPGSEIINRVSAEVKGNSAKINQFKTLFHDVFDGHIDANTVVDINEKQHFIFTHTKFPDIKIEHDGAYNPRNTFVHTILQSCPKEMFIAECKLIRRIVKEYFNSGINFNTLKQRANDFLNPVSKQIFINNLLLAKRIKENNPKSTLDDEEFVDTEIEMMENGELVNVLSLREKRTSN